MAPASVGITIEEATEASEELAAALERLLAQLSASAVAPSAEQLAALVAAPASRLLLARDEQGEIIGMLTLVVFPIPTGVHAWIEDVVVDERARGRGVGAQLSRAALALADRAGARTVELTSRPSREAANRLYRRLGFAVRETNVYRYDSRAQRPSPAPPAQ
jgi:ribosomal protein S18 acetylase RimI-like enzyme